MTQLSQGTATRPTSRGGIICGPLDTTPIERASAPFGRTGEPWWHSVLLWVAIVGVAYAAWVLV